MSVAMSYHVNQRLQIRAAPAKQTAMEAKATLKKKLPVETPTSWTGEDDDQRVCFQEKFTVF